MGHYFGDVGPLQTMSEIRQCRMVTQCDRRRSGRIKDLPCAHPFELCAVRMLFTRQRYPSSIKNRSLFSQHTSLVLCVDSSKASGLVARKAVPAIASFWEFIAGLGGRTCRANCKLPLRHTKSSLDSYETQGTGSCVIRTRFFRRGWGFNARRKGLDRHICHVCLT